MWAKVRCEKKSLFESVTSATETLPAFTRGRHEIHRIDTPTPVTSSV